MSTTSTALTADQVRAFADPLRLQIVLLLAREILCTCHLVEETGAKQPTVSHHLRVLKDAGIVASEPAGSYTYYRLVPDGLTALGAAFLALAERSDVAPRRVLGCD